MTDQLSQLQTQQANTASALNDLKSSAQDLTAKMQQMQQAANSLVAAQAIMQNIQQSQQTAAAAASQSAQAALNAATAVQKTQSQNAVQLLRNMSTPPPSSFGPTLGDYVPCRFTNAAEQEFRHAKTSFGAPTPNQQGTEALKTWAAAAKLPNADALNTILNSASDPWIAIITAVGQGVITGDQALSAATALGQTLQTPPNTLDVGCSESVLTFDETNAIFGRAVAETYVAIQVVGRNLNGDQEFLIHDLQVAVAQFDAAPDTGKGKRGYEKCAINDNPSPPANAKTHFSAGRDRQMVRGVAEVGGQMSLRNLTARGLDVSGSILNGIGAVLGDATFSSAVHVLSAAFIPGFSKIFPDFSTDQLNRLNDFGFSSSSAYKIVIPKNGSVPMTTFIPIAMFAKDFKKWTHCDLLNFEQNMVVVMGGKHIQEVNTNLTLTNLQCPVSGNYLDFSKATNDDFTCQISGTNLQSLSLVRLKNASDATDTNVADGTPSLSGKTDSGTAKFSVKQLSALAAKQYQVYAEPTSGSEQSTTITAVNMPPTIAALSVSQCGSTDSACALTFTGNNLDLAASVKLMAAADSKTPDLTPTNLSAGGTAKSASVQLDLTKLNPAPAQDTAYLIFLTTTDSTDINTGQKLTVFVAGTPSLDTPANPAKVTNGTAALNLTGKALTSAQVQSAKVTLDNGKSASPASAVSASTATGLTVTLSNIPSGCATKCSAVVSVKTSAGKSNEVTYKLTQ